MISGQPTILWTHYETEEVPRKKVYISMGIKSLVRWYFRIVRNPMNMNPMIIEINIHSDVGNG